MITVVFDLLPANKRPFAPQAQTTGRPPAVGLRPAAGYGLKPKAAAARPLAEQLADQNNDGSRPNGVAPAVTVPGRDETGRVLRRRHWFQGSGRPQGNRPPARTQQGRVEVNPGFGGRLKQLAAVVRHFLATAICLPGYLVLLVRQGLELTGGKTVFTAGHTEAEGQAKSRSGRLHCKTSALLNNRETFDVIVHQVRTKPLVPVAANLPVLSYLWGRRCVDPHDRFPTFGQVILKKSRRQPKKLSEERQWFLSKPPATYKPTEQLLTEYRRLCGRRCRRQVIARRLSFGYVRVLAPVVTNKESQVLVVPGSHYYFMVFNCIFR